MLAVQAGEAQKAQNKRNYDASVANLPAALVGAIMGGITGGGALPAILGGLSGAGAGPGARGVARAGMSGYQTGTGYKGQQQHLQAYSDLMGAKTKEDWTKAAMGYAPEAVIKGAFAQPLVNLGGGQSFGGSLLDTLYQYTEPQEGEIAVDDKTNKKVVYKNGKWLYQDTGQEVPDQ